MFVHVVSQIGIAFEGVQTILCWFGTNLRTFNILTKIRSMYKQKWVSHNSTQGLGIYLCCQLLFLIIWVDWYRKSKQWVILSHLLVKFLRSTFSVTIAQKNHTKICKCSLEKFLYQNPEKLWKRTILWCGVMCQDPWVQDPHSETLFWTHS